jgi:two-component system response regulator RegA
VSTEDRADETILVVDDDDVFRERLAHALRRRGFRVSTAADARAAYELARADSPELAVVDLRMPGTSGLDLVRGLLEIDPLTRVLVLTAFGSIAVALEAMRRGAVNFLQKPASVDEVLCAFSPEHRDTPQAFEVPTLADAEWEHIQRVLNECQGNVCRAAKLLGLHRRTLQRKLAKRPNAR